MGLFERYLSVWVALAMLVGVIAGNLVPGVFQTVASLEYAQVNFVIALLIWVMIYPMMVQLLSVAASFVCGMSALRNRGWPFRRYLAATRRCHRARPRADADDPAAAQCLQARQQGPGLRGARRSRGRTHRQPRPEPAHARRPPGLGGGVGCAAAGLPTDGGPPCRPGPRRPRARVCDDVSGPEGEGESHTRGAGRAED